MLKVSWYETSRVVGRLFQGRAKLSSRAKILKNRAQTLLPNVDRRIIFQLEIPAIKHHPFDIETALYRLRVHPLLQNRGLYKVITELAYNLGEHAGGGYLAINEIVEDGRRALEVVAIDNGLGIDDLQEQLRLSELSHEVSFGSTLRGRGTCIICYNPDFVDAQSQGKRWVRSNSGPLYLFGRGSVTQGTYFRLVFAIQDSMRQRLTSRAFDLIRRVV